MQESVNISNILTDILIYILFGAGVKVMIYRDQSSDQQDVQTATCRFAHTDRQFRWTGEGVLFCSIWELFDKSCSSKQLSCLYFTSWVDHQNVIHDFAKNKTYFKSNI